MEKDKPEITEGDICPECGEGDVVVESYKPFYLNCDNCGVRWNDRGQRVPLLNATAGY